MYFHALSTDIMKFPHTRFFLTFSNKKEQGLFKYVADTRTEIVNM